MKRDVFTTCLCAGLCAASVSAQSPADRSTNAGIVPAAYVYVSAKAGTSNQAEVHAFVASSSGMLTSVPGSPFAYSVTFMASNGRYLFGSDPSGGYIHAYKIDADGGLRHSASTNVIQPKNGCDSAGALFLDHTGATIYNVDYYGGNCSDTVYQAFAVERTSGRLQFVDQTPVGVTGSILRFAGNNSYAYGADCGRNPSVYGYIRKGDGSLARISGKVPVPAGKQLWCPRLAAADTMNHVAIAMYAGSGKDARRGPYQLATYTQGEDGTLSTTSTAGNMPTVAVGEVTDLYVSPSGRMLAVAGTEGLQVFQFDGEKPMAPLTGLLTRQEVDQMFWDNSDHLYAVSQTAGKVWVFTVTPTSVAPVLGSPYSVPGALNLVVQPWPLPGRTIDSLVATR